MRILIANRGEIAARIARTVNKLGHTSIALEMPQIKNSPVQQIAAEVVYFKPEWENLSQTYLNPQNITQLAKEYKIEAIHPGYGFLSESPEFAALVEKNNLIFIGPSFDTLRLLADKVQAKKIANKLKIPTIQGFSIIGFDTGDTEVAQKTANDLGYPLIIKAAYGGGGRGMRVVFDAQEFLDLAKKASSEAERAFGNGEIFVEKFIYQAQHVEVQIIGDKFGNCIHLYERDCSLQRKHQKLIEIAPSPNLSNTLLEKLYQDSINLGIDTKLSNAATIEYLVDQKTSEYYFIESNPRLQVEHTITEEITNLDIVELQIKSATGTPLPKQNNIKKSGYAVQLRICAENSDKNFEPSTGKLEHLTFPTNTRIESGYLVGSEITTDYDSLIAKIISKGDSWNAAREKAISALETTEIIGVYSNIPLLLKLLTQKNIVDYAATTTLIENTKISEFSKETEIENIKNSVIDTLSSLTKTDSRKSNPFTHSLRPLAMPAKNLLMTIPQLGFNKIISLHQNRNLTPYYKVNLFEHSLNRGINQNYSIMCRGYLVNCTSDFTETVEIDSDILDSGDITAPLPCQIIGIYVQNGNQVLKGDKLLSFESMKTEYSITAPIDGVVSNLNITKNQRMNRGDLFLSIY